MGKENVSRKDIKKIILKNIYGKTKRKYKKIEWFNKLDSLKNELFNEYSKNGYVKSVIYNKPINNVNKKYKILSYFIQNYETERNMNIISNIFQILNSYESKLILYMYDSFLFDVKIEELNEIFKKIYDTITENKIYSVNVSIGNNFKKMKKLKLCN